MSPGNQHLYDRYYSPSSGFLDGTTEFHRLCARHVRPGARILEIGAGPSNATTRFLASLGPVTGIDVSEEVLLNGALVESRVFDGKEVPFSAASFDAVVSNYVLEHVEDPAIHFSEVARVLRHGGKYLLRTPNLFHYVAGAARFLPHVVHVRASKGFRAMTAEDHDPYPTFYRSNSRRAIQRLARQGGLRIAELQMVEKEPSYGRASPLLFYPMMLYERLVNSSQLGAGFRSNIFAVLEKP